MALLAVLACGHVKAADELSIKQRILMPGEVIFGHSEFEADCEKCHQSFNKSGLSQLCLDCHDEIRFDRNNKKGFHGLNPLSSTKSCNTCHTDHLGRDADIISMQVDIFDHQHTNFPLQGKHVALECSSCHDLDQKYREVDSQCVSCHKDDDFHNGALGQECESCHQPQSWQKRETFDHSTTNFPLEGLHAEAACNSCHAGQVYEFEQTTCITCHKATDVHAGKNGEQCDTCHSVEGWDQRIFDHSTTDFKLFDKHAEIPCRACHTNGIVQKQTPQSCHGCHADDDVHLGRNGKQCDDCHKTVAWNKQWFDHFAKSNFPLDGQHSKLACTQCHSGALTDELPRDCATCHAADDPHKNPKMQICATCHITEGWHTINQFDHHFTNFPLVGMHQIVPCENCHIANQFVGTQGECVNCHKADDHHGGALGEQCETCHSPNAWNLWQFDHQEVVGYALLGAHQDLACDACHKPGSDPARTPDVCGNCHSQQDIHNGGFGKNCGRCHSQNRFFELILQD